MVLKTSIPGLPDSENLTILLSFVSTQYPCVTEGHDVAKTHLS